jgi:hypothetical protein
MTPLWPLAGFVSDVAGSRGAFGMYAGGALLLGLGAVWAWSRAEHAALGAANVHV